MKTRSKEYQRREAPEVIQKPKQGSPQISPKQKESIKVLYDISPFAFFPIKQDAGWKTAFS